MEEIVALSKEEFDRYKRGMEKLDAIAVKFAAVLLEIKEIAAPAPKVTWSHVITFAVMIIAAMCGKAYTITVIWNWHFTTIGLPVITFKTGMGLITASTIFNKSKISNNRGVTPLKTHAWDIFATMVACSIALLIAWLCT